MTNCPPGIIMLTTYIILSSWLSVMTSATIFDMNSQSPAITDLTLHTIPSGTTDAEFGYNAISHVPDNYFKVNVTEIFKINMPEISTPPFDKVNGTPVL